MMNDTTTNRTEFESSSSSSLAVISSLLSEENFQSDQQSCSSSRSRAEFSLAPNYDATYNGTPCESGCYSSSINSNSRDMDLHLMRAARAASAISNNSFLQLDRPSMVSNAPILRGDNLAQKTLSAAPIPAGDRAPHEHPIVTGSDNGNENICRMKNNHVINRIDYSHYDDADHLADEITSQEPRQQQHQHQQGSNNHCTVNSTAVMNVSKNSNVTRAIETHDYHDYANVPTSHTDQAYLARNLLYANSCANKLPFPLKLHKMLDEVETALMDHVISWQPHGRCFKVKSSEDIKPLLDLYFGGAKYSSFQRNLNIYGFKRITRGPDAGSYYHEMFLRGREHLCGRMMRTAVKGTNARLAGNPDEEPNFYSMPPVNTSTSDQSVQSKVQPKKQQYPDNWRMIPDGYLIQSSETKTKNQRRRSSFGFSSNRANATSSTAGNLDFNGAIDFLLEYFDA